ncbi:L-idonate 5-dehydrogenase [Qingshengfaniella alkalisoli]|uniref:L-idonate 5-dehydrogenase n=1 Tax=Qingshengfaniella alkalisoli TaxID=2599296 RepID=A0A5B8J0F4_9RHOB|nr:L-idonate 5-dehydrogenase [Qingshengfaniella alkalisoli]QDY70661.1 L-idonate 5-dehydrogenase [Qingshengfaniella alkalisoli]
METRVCCLHGKNDIRIETRDVTDPGVGEVLISVGAGGICGSDLHYYQDGGFGPIRVREPIILGHEAAGYVRAVGPGVEGLTQGDLVAISPSRPCRTCKFCLQGLQQHCLDMKFSGSAMRMPHEQGLFRDQIVVPAGQCHRLTGDVSAQEAACSEPLSVCLHARNMAGSLDGKRVLVTGSGPIGALCVAVARNGGAAEVVVTDLHDVPLSAAAAMGATRTINMAQDPDALTGYAADKGYFDVAFECSAAAPAIRNAIEALRPQGTLVQVGVAGDTSLPLNLLVSKEITFKGTHRFHAEFAQAAHMISNGDIDVTPMITQSISLDRAVEAFEAAGDRAKAVKVHLVFD